MIKSVPKMRNDHVVLVLVCVTGSGDKVQVNNFGLLQTLNLVHMCTTPK